MAVEVTVQFTTQLRAALGRSEQRVVIPEGCTLAQLLVQLARESPEPFANFVRTADGGLQPSLILCVDDEQVTAPDQYVLPAGATVTLLSAISGG